MAKSQLTMCLCNWARTEQTHLIIEELSRQTCRPTIFVWNNNPNLFFRNDKADVVINCSENMHVRHVPALWQTATTPYVARMDDDLHFADEEVLADALKILGRQKHVTQMVGAYGVNLYEDSSYTDGHHISVPKGHGQWDPKREGKMRPDNIPVDLLKGRIVVANRHAASKLRADCPHYHADLYTSMLLSGDRRFWHVLGSCFFDHETKSPRLLDFAIDGKGYCDMKDHGKKRDELCNKWVKNTRPDPRVKKKPVIEETEDPPSV